jgi:hypothetical protein
VARCQQLKCCILPSETRRNGRAFHLKYQSSLSCKGTVVHLLYISDTCPLGVLGFQRRWEGRRRRPLPSLAVDAAYAVWRISQRRTSKQEVKTLTEPNAIAGPSSPLKGLNRLGIGLFQACLADSTSPQAESCGSVDDRRSLVESANRPYLSL